MAPFRFRRAKQPEADPTSVTQPKSAPFEQDHSAGLIGSDIDRELLRQMQMISLTAEDLSVIRRFKPFIEEYIEPITDAFYETVTEVDQLRDIITTHSTLERLKTTLKVHVAEMFEGRIDDDYIAKRSRIAKAHVRIGLEPKWYIAAFQNLQNAMLEALSNHVREPEAYAKISKIVSKLLNFEQQLVLEAYEREHAYQKEQQYDKVKKEIKGQIVQISSELAALTEQLNASAEEMAASSLEVSQSVSFSVQGSLASREIAVSGDRKVSELGELIGYVHAKFVQMEQSLYRLNEASNQINAISGFVMEIASQTNLLSLNARSKRPGRASKGEASRSWRAKSRSWRRRLRNPLPAFRERFRNR